MTTVYLIRHAQTTGNLEKIFQGQCDVDLTPLGEKQIACLGERCKDLGIELLYSSPLARAYRTAEAINRYYHHEIHTHKGLLEINGGIWEKKKWSVLPEEYPEENDHWCNHPGRFAAPGGETMAQVFNRLRDTILAIVKENPGKIIAIVSHGCALANFLTFCEGKPQEALTWENLCDNAAISKVVFDEDFHPAVVWKNDTDHLGENLKTFVKDLWGEE